MPNHTASLKGRRLDPQALPSVNTASSVRLPGCLTLEEEHATRAPRTLVSRMPLAAALPGPAVANLARDEWLLCTFFLRAWLAGSHPIMHQTALLQGSCRMPTYRRGHFYCSQSGVNNLEQRMPCCGCTVSAEQTAWSPELLV